MAFRFSCDAGRVHTDGRYRRCGNEAARVLDRNTLFSTLPGLGLNAELLPGTRWQSGIMCTSCFVNEVNRLKACLRPVS